MFKFINYIKHKLALYFFSINGQKIHREILTKDDISYDTYTCHINGFDVFIHFIKQSDISTLFCHSYVMFNDTLVANEHVKLSLVFNKAAFVYSYMHTTCNYYAKFDTAIFKEIIPVVETIPYADHDSFDLKQYKRCFNLYTYSIYYNKSESNLSMIGFHNDIIYNRANKISYKFRFTNPICKSLHLIQLIEESVRNSQSKLKQVSNYTNSVINNSFALQSDSKDCFILYFTVYTNDNHNNASAIVAHVMWFIDSLNETSTVKSEVFQNGNVLFSDVVELKIDFNSLENEEHLVYYKTYFIDYFKNLTLMYMPSNYLKTILEIPAETKFLSQDELSLLEMIEF